MSGAGLHAGLYGEIRELAELVDAVIADVTIGTAPPGNRHRLVERLKDITAAGGSGLMMRYLGPTWGRQNWADLADALQQDPAPAWMPDRLEQLARLLDSGRSAALARLHGIDPR
jgi:hypothetical protein